MADLSVILTAADPAAMRMRDHIASWASSGLLRDSVWVTPNDITDQVAGPPRVTATVITPDGVTTDDLFRVVGVRRLALLRLIVVHLLPPGQEVDAALIAQGTRIAELFRTVLPRAIAETDTVGTELRRINLLVPASGTFDLPAGILQPNWDVNAMVSPEDRPDIDRASVFVRDPGNFDGHAAAALSAVAGLWAGIHVGCLDMQETDSTKSDHDLVVLRASVRAVVGDDLAHKLADAAITTIQQDPVGAARLLPWARTARDPREVARRATTELCAHGDWAPGAGTPEADPIQAEKRARDAARDAMRFNVRLFGVAARWLVGIGRNAVENAATGLIVGHGGDYVIRLEPRTPEEIVRLASARLDAQSTYLQRDVLVKEASSVAPPTPSTWPDLRQTCFALADGSEPSTGITIPETAGVRELLPAGAVAPDPEDVFLTGGRLSLRSCDPASASRHQAQLEQAIAEAAKASESDGGPTDVEQVAVPEPGPEVATELEQELKRLERWVNLRRDTVLWELAQDVDARTRMSQTQAQAALEVATTGNPPAIDKVRRAQKTLVRWWIFLSVALVGLSAFFVWRYLEVPTTLTRMVSSICASVLLVVLLAGLVNHLFYRAVRAYEWAVQKLLAARRQTAEEYVAANREASRLGLLSQALLDWSEAIGWILHHPWRLTPAVARTVTDALDTLPAAVAIAVPTEESTDLPIINVVATAGLLCSPGWSSRQFDLVAELHEQRTGADRRDGYLAADTDTLDSAASPRRQLLQYLSDGEAQTAITESARTSVREAVTAGNLQLPARVVARLGGYGDGHDLSDTTFFGATLGTAIPFVIDVWTPRGQQRRRHLPFASTAWIPRREGGFPSAAVSVMEATGDIALRVDLSPTCEPADIANFEAVPDHAPEPIQAHEGRFN
jgi:hypothetical protein